MPTTPSSRPPLKQSRSTGWAWPHLVDKKEQQEQPSKPTITKGGLKQVSAVSSLHNLQSSRGLSNLREEQSAPTSPTHMSSSPRDSMNGHRAEAPENSNAVDDQPGPVNGEPSGERMPEGSSQKQGGHNGERGTAEVKGNQMSENISEDAVHPDDSLPGSFPITPAAVTSTGDRFPGLAQAGLLPTAEGPDTASALSHQFPGLAQVGLLPATNETPVAVEPVKKSKEA